MDATTSKHLDFYGRPITIHQATARTVGKQFLAVATTKEQKAIALYWTGCTMDALKEHGLTLEEYLRINDANLTNPPH